jgi:hypothetical protein
MSALHAAWVWMWIGGELSKNLSGAQLGQARATAISLAEFARIASVAKARPQSSRFG